MLILLTKMDIKTIIPKYIKLDDEISLHTKKAAELRKAKILIEEDIKEYMITNSIAKIDIGSGTLKISKSKPNKKINKKNIMNVLLNNFSDHDKANEIIEEIFEEDETEEITKLERSKRKN